MGSFKSHNNLGKYYCPHFTQEGPKVQRDLVIFQRSDHYRGAHVATLLGCKACALFIVLLAYKVGHPLYRTP